MGHTHVRFLWALFTATLVGLSSTIALAHAAPDFMDDPNSDRQVPVEAPPQSAFLNLQPTATPRSETGIQRWVEDGKGRALRILTASAERTKDADQRTLFTSVYYSLLGADIQWPQDHKDFEGCRKNVLAFVKVKSNTISLCRTIVHDRDFDSRSLAQVLVHEGVHVDGYRDECVATRVEVASMRLSRAGLQFQNDYWKRCGMR